MASIFRPTRPFRLDEQNHSDEPTDNRRLRELGIDPDGDPIEIMLEIQRRAEEREANRQTKKP